MREPIATITPSPARRLVSFLVLAALGAMLVYLGLAMAGGGLFWQLVLIGFGAAMLWLAERLRRATALSILLDGQRLVDSSGRELCRLEDIERIERGAFAFKPSQGFLIRTRRPAGPRGWAPGLWWRLGRYIGIGGTTPAGQGKFMAEMIALHLHRRRQAAPAGRDPGGGDQERG